MAADLDAQAAARLDESRRDCRRRERVLGSWLDAPAVLSATYNTERVADLHPPSAPSWVLLALGDDLGDLLEDGGRLSRRMRIWRVREGLPTANG